MHATTGTKPPATSVSSTRISAPAAGTPTRPRSTTRPSVVECGGAGSTSPQPASAPVRPTAGTPDVVKAATNRVLIVPARTAITTSSVGPSVTRSPST